MTSRIESFGLFIDSKYNKAKKFVRNKHVFVLEIRNGKPVVRWVQYDKNNHFELIIDDIIVMLLRCGHIVDFLFLDTYIRNLSKKIV